MFEQGRVTSVRPAEASRDRHSHRRGNQDPASVTSTTKWDIGLHVDMDDGRNVDVVSPISRIHSQLERDAAGNVVYLTYVMFDVCRC